VLGGARRGGYTRGTSRWRGIALGLARFIRNLIAAAALAAGMGALAAPAWLDQPMKGVPIGTHVELLEDPTGKLTLADVTTRPWIDAFRPATKDNVNLGYRDEALWLRIRLERGAAIGPWMLEVSYPMLDNLEFYAPGSSTPGNGGTIVVTGSRSRFSIAIEPYTGRVTVTRVSGP